MRRRDGHNPKYQPLEHGEEGDHSDIPIQTTESAMTTSHMVSSRRICGSSPCFIFLKVLLGTILSLIVLDITYLEYQAMIFGNPCQIAKDVKHKLDSSPRMIHNKPLPPLPKIIHQQWKTDQIPDGAFSEYHNLWKTLFPEPEYTHMLWTDQSARKLIVDHFSWFLDVYDGYSMAIQRADAVRYFILYKYGGLYADLDYEPFTNFWHALPNDRVSLIESPYKINEQVQNSLMSSPALDTFWNITFQVLTERRESHKVLSSTGPAAMDAAMTLAAATTSTKHNTSFRMQDKTMVDLDDKDDNSVPVHVLPCENFHRIPLAAAGKNAPLITRVARTVMAYSPMVKTCGDWKRRDEDCHYGLHHNSVSYMSHMGDNLWTILKNF